MAPGGLILPAASRIGNPGEDTLLPDTIAELKRLGISPREIALDGEFNVGPTRQTLEDHDLDPNRLLITDVNNPAPNAPNAACGATEPVGKVRSSHLKRGYGLDRSRVKGDEGQQL